MPISPLRVWEKLQHTAQWGRLEIGDHVGLCRESLTDSDREVRDWFVAEAKDIGCEVKVDEMGNIFAIFPGRNSGLAPIGIGSHLDSQPAGGRFDGALGVIAALQVLRAVKESGVLTNAPLAAINWTNEEGSRFPRMCTGSGVWSGAEDVESSHALTDLANPSITLGDELKRIGYLGTTPCSYRENRLSAHFELHIEQGPRLEKAQQKLAVVSGVQGMRAYEIRCQGVGGHAGAVPMAQRADALAALATFVVKTEELARREDAFGTVGVIETDTSSPNTVPGRAFCTLDLRHHNENTLDTIERELDAHLSKLEQDRPGIKTSITKTRHKKSIKFDPEASRCLQQALTSTVHESLVCSLESYAGHDSAETAVVIPTTMLFIPSKNGISHNPAEFSSEEDCEIGAQALLQAVLNYDAFLEGK
ncbi:amidase [Annulohypoxylon maeteangense]|uniref:amidase n=1 Tax=Annulohypoxylon maeteangense TaxID=1927788 RepID=UPI002008685C|nr:amidase [Annulohypoxylon maeteangense]KAI0888479.1 amidase [Annulohypoxylon maeteangense]